MASVREIHVTVFTFSSSTVAAVKEPAPAWP